LSTEVVYNSVNSMGEKSRFSTYGELPSHCRRCATNDCIHDCYGRQDPKYDPHDLDDSDEKQIEDLYNEIDRLKVPPIPEIAFQGIANNKSKSMRGSL